MKLILINGSSCVGKSTVVKALLPRSERLFHLSYDSLKRSFASYSPEKHIHDIRTLMQSVAHTMFTLQYDIVCDSVLWREPREALIAKGKQHGYTVIEINLEADAAVLLERFRERVIRAKEHPEIPISNLSEDRWQELYAMYENEKNPSAPTIRTDTQNPDAVLAEVIRIIG